MEQFGFLFRSCKRQLWFLHREGSCGKTIWMRALSMISRWYSPGHTEISLWNMCVLRIPGQILSKYKLIYTDSDTVHIYILSHTIICISDGVSAFPGNDYFQGDFLTPFHWLHFLILCTGCNFGLVCIGCMFGYNFGSKCVFTIV